MDVKLAIFDFDGTIADSMAQVVLAYNEAAPELRLPPLGAEDLARLRTLSPMQALAALHVPLWKVPGMMVSVRKRLAERVPLLQPFPGVASAIAALRDAGCRLAIVSSNSQPNIESFLARHEIHGFDPLSCDVGMFGKAKRLRALLAQLKVAPQQACYVGDEIRDVEAASAARIASVAVSWGYSERSALQAAGPHHLVDSSEQLVAAVLAACERS